MEFLHGLHSGVRYLVLLAALVALVAALAGWRRRGGDTSGVERGSMAAFVGLVDAQVLIGVVLLTQFPWYPALIGHIVMMVLAAVAAHTGSILARRRPAPQSAAGVRAVTVAITLILIVGGIMAIQRPLL